MLNIDENLMIYRLGMPGILVVVWTLQVNLCDNVNVIDDRRNVCNFFDLIDRPTLHRIHNNKREIHLEILQNVIDS